MKRSMSATEWRKLPENTLSTWHPHSKRAELRDALAASAGPLVHFSESQWIAMGCPSLALGTRITTPGAVWQLTIPGSLADVFPTLLPQRAHTEVEKILQRWAASREIAMITAADGGQIFVAPLRGRPSQSIGSPKSAPGGLPMQPVRCAAPPASSGGATVSYTHLTLPTKA